jgi:hypothetical protein
VGLAKAISGSARPATAMTEVIFRFKNDDMINVAPYFELVRESLFMELAADAILRMLAACRT